MLQPTNLYQYQRAACLHQLYYPQSMLWLGLGLGKTAITLTTIAHRMECLEIKKTLIFAPIRVIYGVWPKERLKWGHTRHLRISIVHGTEKERVKALLKDADVYLVNYENMNWIADYLLNGYIKLNLPVPFEMVVFDEITKLSDSQSLRMAGGTRDRKAANDEYYEVRFTGWKKIIAHVKYTTGLTGTPAAQGYMDLFGQYLALDGGERLGKFITHYRNAYFQKDYNGWSYQVFELGKQAIEQKISDITINMESKDYLDIPEIKETDLFVELPPKARKHYKEIEKELFTRLDTGEEIELFNQASVSNKCLQVCNGSPYTDLEGHWRPLHKAKLDALEEIIEEAGHAPILCSYTYKPDAERIMQRFKKLKPVNMTDENVRDTGKIIKQWNSGKIRLLLGHPASMGEGIDGLQDSGCIVVWFGINWSLRLYLQMNGRIHRQGQNKAVSIIRILCRDTLDEAVAESIREKNTTQQGLKDAISRYRMVQSLP
jgi:SNF2 family DNA or RNA helicase